MQAFPSEPTMPSRNALPLRTRLEGPTINDGSAAPGRHDQPHRAQPKFTPGQFGGQLQDLKMQELRYGFIYLIIGSCKYGPACHFAHGD